MFACPPGCAETGIASMVLPYSVTNHAAINKLLLHSFGVRSHIHLVDGDDDWHLRRAGLVGSFKSLRHFTSSSSTSNFRVALGGMTPPAPRAP